MIDFWTWAKTTPVEYAQNGLNAKSEFEFPLFEHLLDYAEKTCVKESVSKQEVDDVLTILALDNENEDLLSYMQKIPDAKRICLFIEAGIDHPQPSARWQIAELTYRVKPVKYIEYLQSLSADSDPYVRKRSNNCLRYLEGL